MAKKIRRSGQNTKKIIIVLFALVFGGIGVYFLFRSHADAPRSIVGFGGYSCVKTERLSVGSKGDCVRALQYGLNNWNSVTRAGLPALSADGNFDDITNAYVKVFQEKNGLPKTGIVDNRTWGAFLTSCAPFRACTTNTTVLTAP